jgi:hypothetical protein
VESSTGTRHAVVVIRVEVSDNHDKVLLIELLEVGRERAGDRLLGRTTDPASACHVLERWFVDLGRAPSHHRPGDDDVTQRCGRGDGRVPRER